MREFNMYRYMTAFLAATVVWVALSGCQSRRGADFQACSSTDCYEDVAAQIEYPAISSCSECCEDATASLEPFSVGSDLEPEYWDVSLEEVVQMALTNSTTLHDLGGIVVRAPGATSTQYDSAIAETDPNLGIEAALSAFDADLTSDVFFDKNDQELNNRFQGGGIRQFQQDLMNWNTRIRKRAVTGSEFTILHHMDYDANNAPGNAFPSVFNTWVEGEIRHPLLQGGGTLFNRIAGPTRQPGQYNGVLIARLNTDIALTEFEVSVRNFISNVENTYWDLYFAYRDLHTKIAARDAALDTWRTLYARRSVGREGGDADQEAQAREQFFRFQSEVENALGGRLLDGTRTNNGSPGGTVRGGTSGVLVTERRLRTLLGLPATDGRLLRPADEPVVCTVAFDWPQVAQEATTRRVELRRQRWVIRRRELELIASKNHLLPRLDAVGLYRVRGFGKHLFGTVTDPPPDMMTPGLNVTGASAYDQLASGDYQEWQLGVELTMPFGFRRAHTAVKNAELLLARERAILCDMQKELVRQTSDAVAEVDRAYVTYWTNYDRVLASQEQLAALKAKEESGVEVPLHLLLDAQKRLADAQSEFHRSATEFAVATKNVHFCKGTLLEYDGVYLNEGSWPCGASEDAAELEKRRGKPRELNYASSQAPIVSGGRYAQNRGAAYSSPTSVESPAAPAAPPAEELRPGSAVPEIEPLPNVFPPAADRPMSSPPEHESAKLEGPRLSAYSPAGAIKSRAEEIAASPEILTGQQRKILSHQVVLDAPATASGAVQQTSAVQPTGTATTPPAAPQFVR